MVLMRTLIRGVVLNLVVLLAACTTYTPPATPPPPVEKPPQPKVVAPPAPAPQPQHRPTSPSASAAWQPLIAKARQASERGDYEQALALLERAQRIDPDSAEVYLCMAQTHRAKGDSAQARATAERGLLYCVSAAQCDALRAFAH